MAFLLLNINTALVDYCTVLPWQTRHQIVDVGAVLVCIAGVVAAVHNLRGRMMGP
jgi:hypothetical protein